MISNILLDSGQVPLDQVQKFLGLLQLLLMTAPDGNELLHGSMALRVELWFYVAIVLGLGRNRWTARVWFPASVVYTLWLLTRRTPFPERYAGNLSYPMYLCHWGVGIALSWLLPGTTRYDNAMRLSV